MHIISARYIPPFLPRALPLAPLNLAGTGACLSRKAFGLNRTSVLGYFVAFRCMITFVVMQPEVPCIIKHSIFLLLFIALHCIIRNIGPTWANMGQHGPAWAEPRPRHGRREREREKKKPGERKIERERERKLKKDHESPFLFPSGRLVPCCQA